MKTALWKSPSGRYHQQKMCSGGAGHRNVRRELSDKTLAKLEVVPTAPSICKCAIGVRDKARARLEPS